MSKSKSIREPKDRLATYADIMAVVSTCAQLVGDLELRVEHLERRLRAIEPVTEPKADG